MTDLTSAIRSLTPGRVRLRTECLMGLSPELIQSLTQAVMAIDGVTSASINPRVGSMLVTWDETKVTGEMLLEAAQWGLASLSAGCRFPEVCEPSGAEASEKQCCLGTSSLKALWERTQDNLTKSGHTALDVLAPIVAPDQRKGKGARARRVTQNRLMLAGFVGSLGALAINGTRAHIVLGTAFTLLLAVHLYQHRNVL